MLIKKLKIIYLNSSGHNINGRITVRGRCYKKYFSRFCINKSYRLVGVRNIVLWIGLLNYCSSFIVLYKSLNSILFYSVATSGIKLGQETLISTNARNFIGNSLPLYLISLTSDINSVENERLSGSVYSRAAGTFSRVIRKNSRTGYVVLRLPSKQFNYIKWDCFSTVGIVSNELFFMRKYDKAGVSRKFGFKSKVRGVAMNPVDHPMGGGEGKSSGGRFSCSPWGWKTKGPKTKNNVRNRFLIRLKLRVNKIF